MWQEVRAYLNTVSNFHAPRSGFLELIWDMVWPAQAILAVVINYIIRTLSF